MLDNLIHQFESEYRGHADDNLLWKSYFQANAELITLCNFCSTQEAASTEEKSSSTVERNRRTRARPCDISDDDDDEDGNEGVRRSFESATVILSSIEGRIISRWLGSARKELQQL